jgi:hypothetical protein
MTRVALLVLAALGLGVFAGVGTFYVQEASTEQALSKYEKVLVLFAVEDIPKGTSLFEATTLKLVEYQLFPEEFLPDTVMLEWGDSDNSSIATDFIPSGTLVLEKELGTFESGKHTLQWDGKNSKGEPLKDGIYTYTIRARDINENNFEVPLASKAIISGVDLKSENGGIYSGLGPLGFDEIRSVGTPGFDKASATKQASNMSTADELKKLQAEENLKIETNEKSKDNKVETAESAASQLASEQKVDKIDQKNTDELTSKTEVETKKEESQTTSAQDVKAKAESDKSEDKKKNFDFSSIPITIQPPQKS